jgi:hypothetical protein
MRSGLIVFLAAGAVVGVAIIEGIRSNRWGANEDLQVAAVRLQAIPCDFGNWVSVDSPLDEKIVRIAEAVGYISRNYLNRKNGERFDVLLLCGPSGPIGAHTPEACYTGLGYSCNVKPTRKDVHLPNGVHSSFWTARFEKISATEKPLMVYWAWSVDGDWDATTNPRADFALRPALYKLYIVYVDPSEKVGSDSNQDAIMPFLNEFLPLVKIALTQAQS